MFVNILGELLSNVQSNNDFEIFLNNLWQF